VASDEGRGMGVPAVGIRCQVPPKSAKGRISLGLRRIRPKPCGGFGCQVSERGCQVSVFRFQPGFGVSDT
jgi:hypothetical protein